MRKQRNEYTNGHVNDTCLLTLPGQNTSRDSCCEDSLDSTRAISVVVVYSSGRNKSRLAERQLQREPVG